MFNLVNTSPYPIAWSLASFRGRQLAAAFFVKATFRLVPDGVVQPLEDQPMPEGCVDYPDTPDGSLRYDMDFAPFKPAADVLLTGACHAPKGKPTRTCNVSFRVGDWSKRLAVIGERTWERKLLARKPSDPKTFTSMPLRWELAFGGEGFKTNPVGRGHKNDFVPCIEYPDQLLASSGQKPTPAGFGPIRREWPPRTEKLGTYDKEWLKERFPWFPRDFDYQSFNAAPLDQRIEGFLRGDEEIGVENMHPEFPLLRTKLPGIRPRFFVADFTPQTQQRFREAPLKLDTLHVDMDDVTVTLVWRGALDVESKDLREVTDLYVEIERLSESPLPADHYRRRLPAVKAELAKAAEEEMLEFGPADFAPPVFPEAEFLADMAKVEEAVKKAEQAAMAAKPPVAKSFPHASVPAGVTPTSAPPAKLPKASEVLKQALAQRAQKLETLGKMSKEAAGKLKQVKGFDEAAAWLADEEKELEKETPQEEDDEIAEVVWTRDTVEEHAKNKGSFAGEEFRELNLDGIDFSGCDFSAAVFEECTMRGVNLRGANLHGALLVNCDLCEADLAQADLSEADLSEARLRWAVLAGADLRQATLNFIHGGGCDFRSVKAQGAQFNGAALHRCDFRGGVFEGADFGDADVTRATFARCNLREASFVGVKAQFIDLREADAFALRARDGADFSKARLERIQADESIWQDSNIEGADFSFSSLKVADFTDAKAKGASFFAADLSESRFVYTTAIETDFRYAKLYCANMDSADVLKAVFTNANLFGVSLLDARIAGADIHNAVELDKSLIGPARS